MFQLPQQNTARQFTIRFDSDLYELFDEIHNQTRIPKSNINPRVHTKRYTTDKTIRNSTLF